MLEWEERNLIGLEVKWNKTKKKKTTQKGKKRVVNLLADKENTSPLNTLVAETKREKELRIQKLTEYKINEWILNKSKESWMSLKIK